MQQKEHDRLMKKAEAVIKNAQEVRLHHRKRTKIGHHQRSLDIGHSIQEIKAVMKPIRRAIGRIPYDPANTESQKRHVELRAMSQRLQAERRKLWKLRGGKSYKSRVASYRAKIAAQSGSDPDLPA